MFKTLGLIRPINLIIIILTMMVFQCYFYTHPDGSPLFSLVWMLKVVVMIALAASGNVINDFFDQKVDLSNGRYNAIAMKDLSVNKALVLYGLILSVSFFGSLGLYQLTNSLFYLFVNMVMAFGLFLYTPIFKKTIWLGNIWVAACLSFVPIWTLWGNPLFQINSDLFIWTITFALFAFFINWNREIIKDVQDAEGDKSNGCHSIYLRYGMTKTMNIVRFIFALNALLTLFFMVSENQKMISIILLGGIVFLPSVFLLFKTKYWLQKGKVQLLSHYLKIWMAISVFVFLSIP